MSNVDRILDTIDAGLAACPASDASYEPDGTNDLDVCWRCALNGAASDVGLCGSCLVDLRRNLTAPAAPAAPLSVLEYASGVIRRIRDWREHTAERTTLTSDDLMEMLDIGLDVVHATAWLQLELMARGELWIRTSHEAPYEIAGEEERWATS